MIFSDIYIHVRVLIKCWKTCLHQKCQVPPAGPPGRQKSLQPRSAWHLKISRFFVASEVVGVYSNTYQGWPSSICSQGKSCRVAFLTRDWTWHLKEAEMSESSTWCWTFSFERVGYGKSPKLMWHSGIVSCPVQCRLDKYLKAVVIPLGAHVPCCPPVFPLCSVDWPWLSRINAMINVKVLWIFWSLMSTYFESLWNSRKFSGGYLGCI